MPPFKCPKTPILLYFANGMNNLENDAQRSLDAIGKTIKQATSKQEGLSPIHVGHVLYNSRQNILSQLLEAFMQKMHEFHMNFWNWLFDLSSAPDWFRNKLLNLIMLDEWNILNGDDLDLQLKLIHEALEDDNMTLIVGHSQGNFFANSIYRLVKHGLKKRVALVGVATPSDKVEGGGPYVTLTSDGVIQSLIHLGLKPTPLSPNVTNENPKPGYFDHAFLTHYLRGVPTGNHVVEGVVSQIKKLADVEDTHGDIREVPPEDCVTWFQKGLGPKMKDYKSCYGECFVDSAGPEGSFCFVYCHSLCGCFKKTSSFGF